MNSANFSCSEFLFSSWVVIVWISDSRSLTCLWYPEILTLFWEISLVSFVTSLESLRNWRSRSSSFWIAVSSSWNPDSNSSFLLWASLILFKRNSSSIPCVQVGHTVFSLKNLCSLVMVATLLDILPFRLFNFDNFWVAPVTSSCFLVRSFTSSSVFSN